MDNFTVLLRNRNEQDYVGFTLQSIHDFLPKSKVIVLDNNSTDDSLDIVSLFNNRLNITVVNIDRYSPGRSLNIGANLAETPYVLIISGHSQIVSLNISAVEDKLKDYVAVFGKQTPIYKGKKITKRYIWSHFTDDEQVNMFSKIENRQFLHNAFCFYDREFLLRHPFDESLPAKEERYWAADVVDLGQSYYYLPQAEVNHYWTPNGATWKGIG